LTPRNTAAVPAQGPRCVDQPVDMLPCMCVIILELVVGDICCLIGEAALQPACNGLPEVVVDQAQAAEVR
jgi:hypothetical protein